MKNTILYHVRMTAKKEPHRLFGADEGRKYCYDEAWNSIRATAVFLQEIGIRRGDRILVECTQDIRFLLTILSIQLAGAVAVPLEAGISAERAEEIRHDTDAVLIIPDKVIDVRCESVRLHFFDEDVIWEDSIDSADLQMPSPGKTAEILYTTGTTGKSKGIEITHANNTALAENICFGTQMRAGNVELIPLAISHSHGLRTCYANLCKGGSVIITNGVSRVLMLYQMIKEYGVTALDISPAAAAVLLRLTKGRFSEFNEQFDYIQLGTAALPESTKAELIRQFPDVRLYNFYGSTEAGRSCVLNFNSTENRAHCIGFPAKHARFIVTDEAGNEIRSSKDHTGLLACAGDMVMRGYWKQETLTEEVMHGGYLLTKDEGYIDEDGRIYCLGRRDDVINYRGFKIAPEEIEEIASRAPGIADCACIGVPDPSAGQVPVLFFTLKTRRKIQHGTGEDPRAGELKDQNETADVSHAGEHAKEVMKYLQAHLDKERMPKRAVLCEEIPRTPNGKIIRGALRERII